MNLIEHEWIGCSIVYDVHS